MQHDLVARRGYVDPQNLSRAHIPKCQIYHLLSCSRHRRSQLKLKMEIGDIPVLTLLFYGYKPKSVLSRRI